jgi:hypothetical protein
MSEDWSELQDCLENAPGLLQYWNPFEDPFQTMLIYCGMHADECQAVLDHWLSVGRGDRTVEAVVQVRSAATPVDRHAAICLFLTHAWLKYPQEADPSILPHLLHTLDQAHHLHHWTLVRVLCQVVRLDHAQVARKSCDAL